MPDRLCAVCHAWLCAARDAFCGICAAPCADLRLDAFPAIVQIGHLAPRIGLRLHNLSCAMLRINDIDSPEWAQQAGDRPLEVSSYDTVVFHVRPRTSELESPVAGDVRVRTSAGTAAVTIMAIAEEPRILVSPAEIPLWFDEDVILQSVVAALYPSGGALRLIGIQDPELPWLRISGVVKESELITGDHPWPITLEARRPDTPKQEATRGGKFEMSLHVHFEGAHGPASVPVGIRFALRNPPECVWNEVNSKPPERMLARKQLLTFNFSNSSGDPYGGRRNAALIIHDAVLSNPNRETPIKARPLTAFPLEIEGGKTGSVGFEVDFDGPEFETTPGGRLQKLSLQVTTNRQSLNRSYLVSILLTAVPEYTGMVAIDFGTSNTTFCLMDGDGLQTLSLDDFGSSVPTVVQYLDLSGSSPDVETGALLQSAAATDAAMAASIVSRLKQSLGDERHQITVRPMHSKDWLTRETTQVAADYLHHLRVMAEHRKGVRFREFIVTHPAVCSLRQYRNLRNALRQAFGGEAQTIHFLQEPIAALLPFVSERADTARCRDYSVAAFDLGGGTTDVSVIRVHHHWSGNSVRIHPQIISSWGERFGGEDLTDFLVAELLSRCTHLIANDKRGFRLAAEGVDGASEAEIRRNVAACRQWAESFKASLSDERGGIEMRRLILRVVPDDPDKPPDEVGFDVGALDAAGRKSIETAFHRYLKSEVERLARRLQGTLAPLDGALDFLQLSGKTTLLPAVSQTMASLFSATKIHRAAEPKECVARGACLSRALITGNKRLSLPDSQRTTSRLGLLDTASGMFLEIIPSDCTIPDGGLSREMPNAWMSGSVVVWENLGNRKSCLSPDGTRDKLLQRLGRWDPEDADSGAGERCTLRFTVTAMFEFAITAVSAGGRTIHFTQWQGGVA